MSKTCCRMLLEPGASVPKRQGKHTLEYKVSHFAFIFVWFFQSQHLLNKPSVGGSSVGSSVSGCSGVGATVGATVGCGFGGRGRGLHLWNYNNFRNIFFQYNNHFVFLNILWIYSTSYFNYLDSQEHTKTIRHNSIVRNLFIFGTALFS